MDTDRFIPVRGWVRARLAHVEPLLSLVVALLAALVPPSPSAFAPGQSRSRDAQVGEQLGRLRSERLEERLAAERWLGAHLERADFASAAQAARSGDAELRRRLSWAIAADSRNLGLAALLLTDGDPRVEEVGQVAVLELIDRWNAGAGEAPLARGVLPGDWLDSETRRLSIDMRTGGLAGLVDRIERLAPAPATVVLDPGLAPGIAIGGGWPKGGGAEFEGVWPDLIEELARVHRVGFEVHGQRVPLRGSRPWVRIYASGAREGGAPTETTADLCVEWCRGVLREEDPAWNFACARALASIGWPAAISWFEELWAEDTDAAALEALLLAASSGRVAPSFPGPERLAPLFAQVDRDLAERASGALGSAQRLALAVAAAAQIGTQPAWGQMLTKGWERLAEPSRWMRLIALEGYGRGGQRVRELARSAFTGEGSNGLRLQALRTLASAAGATDGTPNGSLGRIQSPTALFDGDAEWLDTLTRQLSIAAVPFPPGDWYARLEDPESVLAALSWALDAGGEQAAVDLFWKGVRSGSAGSVGQRLKAWCGMARAGDVSRLLGAARDAASNEAERAWVARVKIRAGQLSEDEQRAALDRLLGKAALDREELRDLGSLCSSATIGWRAREALVEQVAKVPQAQDLLPALEIALAGLRRARLDGEKDVLASRLRTAAQAAKHPVLEVLYSADWPPQPGPAPLALDALDRRIAFPED